MSTYPIESTSISFNDIKSNLIRFVENKPDADKWKDYYEGSEGTILIELIAGYGFYNTLKAIFGREETYLNYVNTLSSARAIAQTYSYSAFRGRNRRYVLKFKSPYSFSIPKDTVIGSSGNYDVITAEDTLIRSKIEQNGEMVEYENIVEVIVGTQQQASLNISSSGLHIFRFNGENVSNDYTLFLNEKIVPTTEISGEALQDKYLVRTNAAGGVDIIYMNRDLLAPEMFPNQDLEKKDSVSFSPQYSYRSGDKLSIKYVQYEDIPAVSEFSLVLSDEENSYFIDSEEISVEKMIPLEKPESIESIQVKSPIMYETQYLIRGREDYAKNFLLLKSAIVDTTSRDLSPAYVELSYSQKDGLLYSDEEIEELRTTLASAQARTFGIPKPYINQPRLMKIVLNVRLKSLSIPEDPKVYENQIFGVLKKYEYKFSDELESVSIDLAGLEREIESLDNIKRADVSIDKTGFVSGKYYTIGDIFHITRDSEGIEYAYRVSNIAYKTGVSEPNWSTKIGERIEDENIIWEAVPKTGYPKSWSSEEYVSLYETRVPSTSDPDARGIMYRAIKGYSYTSSSKDAFPTIDYDSERLKNNLIYDNEIIWKLLPGAANPYDSEWKQSMPYSLSDCIQRNSVSYQMISEQRQGKSSPKNIDTELPKTLIHEGLVLTRELLSDEEISIPFGTYCIIEPKIVVIS